MARKVRVVRKDEVEGNVKALLHEANGRKNGLFFANGAYTVLKGELRAHDLTNEVISTEMVEVKGKVQELYKVSEWTSENSRVKVVVEYRQPMYVNSLGTQVRGKRIRIQA